MSISQLGPPVMLLGLQEGGTSRWTAGLVPVKKSSQRAGLVAQVCDYSGWCGR